jgi:hypothetical protein
MRARIVLKLQGVPESGEGGTEFACPSGGKPDSCDCEEAIACSAKIRFAIILMIARGAAGHVLKGGKGSLRDNPLPFEAGGLMCSN